MYYRGAQAALVVYDITKAGSFRKAQHWVAELQRQASPGIVIALVGNKRDLVDSASGSTAKAVEADDDGEGEGSAGADEADSSIPQREVTEADAKQYADEESLFFYETSAKTGANVAEVFTTIAGKIPETALKARAGQGARSSQAALAGAGGRGADDARVTLGRGGDNSGAKEGCAC